jgi:GNAT superfamily N-acetyltransferase
MRSTLTLRRLSRADWATLRAVRIEALSDSPMAFMSRLEDEQALTESDWQRAFDGATWTVAEVAGAVIGLVKVVREPILSPVRYLESIWVAPLHRRNRVFSALLARIIETERREGASDLLIWVLEDNHPARRVYEACGFRPTGRSQLLRHLGRIEVQLGLSIRSPAD